MSSYILDIPSFGPIKVTKKRGMKSIRMRISPSGDVLVSSPWHVPKEIIYRFVQERTDWIHQNTSDSSEPFRDGMVIGSSTILKISDGYRRNSSHFLGHQLRILLSESYDPLDHNQQRYIQKKVMEALQTEADNTLLPRLDQLAVDTGHSFNQAYTKRLTSRWGSCDQYKNITLNIFLVQLPKKLQDYVMLHELTHTIYMDHSPAFWKHMENLMPSVKLYRKLLKAHKPRVETK